jgi:hypothetical protein
MLLEIKRRDSVGQRADQEHGTHGQRMQHGLGNCGTRVRTRNERHMRRNRQQARAPAHGRMKGCWREKLRAGNDGRTVSLSEVRDTKRRLRTRACGVGRGQRQKRVGSMWSAGRLAWVWAVWPGRISVRARGLAGMTGLRPGHTGSFLWKCAGIGSKAGRLD